MKMMPVVFILSVGLTLNALKYLFGAFLRKFENISQGTLRIQFFYNILGIKSSIVMMWYAYVFEINTKRQAKTVTLK